MSRYSWAEIARRTAPFRRASIEQIRPPQPPPRRRRSKSPDSQRQYRRQHEDRIAEIPLGRVRCKRDRVEHTVGKVLADQRQQSPPQQQNDCESESQESLDRRRPRLVSTEK